MSDRIQIEILNSESNSVSVDGINQPQEQSQLNEKSSKVIKQAAVIGAMASTAKSIVSYGLNNYGNFTGDYIGQTRINETLKAVSYASAIGAGFAMGGPVGGAMATMAVATNLFLENISLMDKEKKATIQAEQLRILTGTYRNSGGRDRWFITRF